MNWKLALGLLIATGAALALRCPKLDERPMHNDEAVNAVKFGQLWEHGDYKYDPDEHHGPALAYATFAISKLTGAPKEFAGFNETRMRIVAVIFGLGLIILLPLFTDGLGKTATLWAGMFSAISPAFVFYSRDYIHETLLVFFTFLAIAAGWRYSRSLKTGWALVTGVSLGLMNATKETFVLPLAAMMCALLLNSIWNRWVDATRSPNAKPRFNIKHAGVALAAWLVVSAILFSSFFSNSGGPLDAVKTYSPWLNRAGGDSPHIHPWNFYLHRLIFFHAKSGAIFSEAFILLLAAFASVAAFRRKGIDSHAGLIRVLAFYTAALTAAYSFIPYKTPWCLLGFWHGVILLAGVGAAAAILWAKWNWQKVLVGIFLLAGTGHLVWQAWQENVSGSVNRKNPYTYAETSPDILNLVGKVESLAQASPQHRQLLIKVMSPDSDYWPLPWYLRGFKKIGWWNEVPPTPFAPIMIVSKKLHANLDENKTHFMAGYFQLRPGIFFELYVQTNFWTIEKTGAAP